MSEKLITNEKEVLPQVYTGFHLEKVTDPESRLPTNCLTIFIPDTNTQQFMIKSGPNHFTPYAVQCMRFNPETKKNEVIVITGSVRRIDREENGSLRNIPEELQPSGTPFVR